MRRHRPVPLHSDVFDLRASGDACKALQSRFDQCPATMRRLTAARVKMAPNLIRGQIPTLMSALLANLASP